MSNLETLRVTGAGLGAVNGIYSEVGDRNGKPLYSLIGGSSVMYWHGCWGLALCDSLERRCYEAGDGELPPTRERWMAVAAEAEPGPAVSWCSNAGAQSQEDGSAEQGFDVPQSSNAGAPSVPHSAEAPLVTLKDLARDGHMRAPMVNTFIDIPGDVLPPRDRSRSAPARQTTGHFSEMAKTCRDRFKKETEKELREQRREGQPRSRRRPQEHTRKKMETLSLDDLMWILRERGLEKLHSDEDRRLAERIMPNSPDSPPQVIRRIHSYLEGLTWTELIGVMQDQLAKRRDRRSDFRLAQAADPNAHHFAESLPDYLRDDSYFKWVCDVLLTSQLRHAEEETERSLFTRDSSVMPWRMAHFCAQNGLSRLWDEVLRRLGRGEMLLLTTRPVPYLHEERRALEQLVRHCHVAPITATRAELERLAFNCDVLYLAGMHDSCGKLLPHRLKLRTLRAPLAILNVCCSEDLARRLLSQGVANVAYWPSPVQDAVAVAFGTEFVRHLFRLRIADAFHEARRSLGSIGFGDTSPRLLVSGAYPSSGSDALRRKLLEPPSSQATQSDDSSGSASLQLTCTNKAASHCSATLIDTYKADTPCVETQVDPETEDEEWLEELCWGHRRT